MFESRLLSKLAAAASVIGHLALVVAILVYAGVRPFQTESAKAITVDLVEPDEIKPPEQAAKPPEPEPTLPDLKPSIETPPRPEPQSASSTQQQQQAAPPQPAAPAFKPPEPDITVKYGVMLGLPESSGKNDFDAAAAESAKLESTDITAFRRHLRTCSKMPDTIGASDDVWIKLRAVFTHDGRLAVPPALIEGKASPKAIALAHSAIAALQACQPYAMLPAAKYDEWKVLDLEFSPKDFVGG